VARLPADDTTEVALVHEANIGGEAREAGLPARQALECISSSNAHTVARDRLTGRRTEYAAEMMRRHPELSSEVGERAIWVLCQRFADAVGQRAASAEGGRPSSLYTAPIHLLERASR